MRSFRHFFAVKKIKKPPPPSPQIMEGENVEYLSYFLYEMLGERYMSGVKYKC